MQLTPKKVLALMLGIGLPVVISAGWALGQRASAETADDGAGAMGTAPEERVSSPAAYDVYDDGPVVVPMASAAATPTPTPSGDVKTAVTPGPYPSGATPLPEDETPSPEPSPADQDPTPEPSTPVGGG